MQERKPRFVYCRRPFTRCCKRLPRSRVSLPLAFDLQLLSLSLSRLDESEGRERCGKHGDHVCETCVCRSSHVSLSRRLEGRETGNRFLACASELCVSLSFTQGILLALLPLRSTRHEEDARVISSSSSRVFRRSNAACSVAFPPHDTRTSPSSGIHCLLFADEFLFSVHVLLSLSPATAATAAHSLSAAAPQ